MGFSLHLSLHHLFVAFLAHIYIYISLSLSLFLSFLSDALPCFCIGQNVASFRACTYAVLQQPIYYERKYEHE